MAPRVVTVTGPVPPERIGFTLPHEHLSCRPELVRTRSELLDYTSDPEVMRGELHDFRRRGGSCVVDLTSAGLGRDPTWLRNLATGSGVYVVMGAGWYRDSFYPPEAGIDRRSVDDLADELVAEFEHGVGDTGVRPGIIGEIGTDRAWVSPREERVFRAVARAAKRTGMAVSTHALQSEVGLDQLHILEEEGLDPGRVVSVTRTPTWTSTTRWRCSTVEPTWSSTCSGGATNTRPPTKPSWSRRSWSSWSVATPAKSCSATTRAAMRSSRRTADLALAISPSISFRISAPRPWGRVRSRR